jgi:D-galactose 1-dehydrogenase
MVTQQTAASPIHVAIIGAGKIARDQHVPAIGASDAFSLIATVDTGRGVDGVANYPDLAALLASGTRIDAVAICTPPQIRGAIARAAIASGLHVLLEKPPAATLTELATLTDLAKRAGVSLFAAWHSRFAPMVGEARAWLAGRTITGGRVTWRESVRRWHPGQAWLWAAGGLGVFDPGINALSILTEISPEPLGVTAARLAVPGNAQTPIAAQLTLAGRTATIPVDFDFREEGAQSWLIVLETRCGHSLRLSNGGAVLSIDGQPERTAPSNEYPALYSRFAALIGAAAIDADPAPLRLVADALLVAETDRVGPFVE